MTFEMAVFCGAKLTSIYGYIDKIKADVFIFLEIKNDNINTCIYVFQSAIRQIIKITNI